MAEKLKEMSLNNGGVDPERIDRFEHKFDQTTRELMNKLTEN